MITRPRPDQSARDTCMNKKDRSDVTKAINLLMSEECRFQEAMVILGRLVGIRFPAFEDKAKPVNVVVILTEMMTDQTMKGA